MIYYFRLKFCDTMNIKKHIPNLITLGNLLSGTIASILAVKGDFYGTAIMVILGISFDFFDGFAARILKVQGDLGKQLDSLADMVTSGVVPGIVMLQMLINAIDLDAVGYFGIDHYGKSGSNLPYLGLLLTLSAGYRLAKFNIDSRQSDHFIGLPTPAMSLFVISLPLIYEYGEQQFFLELLCNEYLLILITLLLSFLMNAEIPLFSLKFKSFRFKDNWIKFMFLMISILLIVMLKIIAVPIIILLYVFISVFQNIAKN